MPDGSLLPSCSLTMAAVAYQGYDLSKLYDKLNLTGKVVRVGQHAVSSGGCANVWEGDLLGTKVAVKVIREIGVKASQMSLKKRLVREVRAWTKLHHRNVLPLLGFTYGFDTSSRLASLVSPWMPQGTATVYLEKRSTSERIRVLTGVADGLCYLHRHDVVHGDLKGSNILIDDKSEPRLADFGLSKLLTEVGGSGSFDTNTASQLGSLRWMARELFDSSDTAASVTYESDVWAFGMTALELFTSHPPYYNLKNEPQVIIHVHKGILPERPDARFGLDDDIWDLCNSCWDSNPELRPSTRVIAKRLWDLDLRCKLRSRPKRRSREPDSPDQENGVQLLPEERLRKSPKLSTLAELAEDTGLASPEAPLSSSRMLTRVPVSRSASSSDMSCASSNASFNDVDPRQLFMPMRSEGDIYTAIHNHQERRLYPARTNSEPVLQNLATHNQSIVRESSGLGLQLAHPPSSYELDESSALMSTRYPGYNMEQAAFRQSTYHLHGSSPHYDHHHHHHHHTLFSEGECPDLGRGLPCRYDASHPSQWTSFYPPHSSSYHLPYAQEAMRSYSVASSSHSDFLSLPISNSAELDLSPQDTPLLSPHQLGPVFSEAFITDFIAEEPTSFLDDSSLEYTSAPVDYNTLRHGIISPAFSDVTPNDLLVHTHDPAVVPDASDTPVISDFDSFDVFDEDSNPGLSLFGGWGISDATDEPEEHHNMGTMTPTQRTPRQSPRVHSFEQLRSPPPSPQADGQLQMPPTPRLSPFLSSF